MSCGSTWSCGPRISSAPACLPTKRGARPGACWAMMLSLRDRTREADVWVRLETALQDMRYAARTLWRAPLFTIAATLTLAIGIGVNTAMFAVVYGVLIRPLPYADADRLYLLFQTSGRAGRTRVTPLDFVDLQAQVAFDTDRGRGGQWVYLHGPGRSGARRRAPGERRVLQPARREAGARAHVRNRG